MCYVLGNFEIAVIAPILIDNQKFFTKEEFTRTHVFYMSYRKIPGFTHKPI
jgi:hypothetical protein